MTHYQPAYRYELKYLIKQHQPQQLETVIKLHQLQFKEIYYQRVVNNVYCDDQRLQNYYDNLSGIAQRSKVRWRWYAQLPPHQQLHLSQQLRAVNLPHLEIKVKEADLVKKYLFASDEMSVTGNWQVLPTKIRALFKEQINNITTRDPALGTDKEASDQQSALVAQASLLKPVLVNSYQRRYFLSADKNIRLTIDTNIIFFSIKDGRVNWRQYWQLPATILEMKANPDQQQLLSQASKYFPFKLSRCSKYVLGISSCYPDLEAPNYQMPVHPQLAYDY